MDISYAQLVKAGLVPAPKLNVRGIYEILHTPRCDGDLWVWAGEGEYKTFIHPVRPWQRKKPRTRALHPEELRLARLVATIPSGRHT